MGFFFLFIASLQLYKVPKEKHLGDINKKGRQSYSSYIAKQGVYPEIYVLICLITVGQNPLCRFFYSGSGWDFFPPS
jgi:hypothetical protein